MHAEVTMLSLISLAATVPMLATSTIQLQDTAQSTTDKAQSNKDEQEDIKTEKCHFQVRATARTAANRAAEVKDMMVFLQNGSLRLRHRSEGDLHPFTGYFLPYPDTAYDGLVTTINRENMLNWVYVDKSSYALKYGVRADAQPHLTVPMKLIHAGDEDRLTFNKFEGFLAVEEESGNWALRFDKEDNGLQGKVPPNTKVTEIELLRIAAESADEDSPD